MKTVLKTIQTAYHLIEVLVLVILTIIELKYFWKEESKK